MGILKNKFAAFIFLGLVTPFLLANKNCQRDITWGDPSQKFVSLWADDHKDIDRDTKCADCHDTFKKRGDKPESHKQPGWIRTHGDYSQIKYGFEGENVCALCHQKADCSSCHQQDPPQDHTFFWKAKGHGLATGLARDRCMACHEGVDFCERCHAETKPTNHVAASWGSTRNNHCQSCHLSDLSAQAQTCAVCHQDANSHDLAPNLPRDANHATGLDCRSCHTALRHADNGADCQSCHN